MYAAVGNAMLDELLTACGGISRFPVYVPANGDQVTWIRRNVSGAVGVCRAFALDAPEGVYEALNSA